MRLIIFWVRFWSAVLWFFVGTFISIVLLPFRWKDPSMGAVLGRIVNWGGCKAFGYKVEVENSQALYVNQPCIYVANHQSNMDIITMGCMYPYRTVVIGKKELKWLPLFGLFFAGAGNIMIDRQNIKNSVAGLDAAKDEMMKRGVSIWLFPEGTRNRGRDEMLPFKKGAFHLAISAQVPIVPIVHQHLKSYMDYENRILAKGPIRIKVLDPVSTKGMTLEDLPKLMADVRARMEAELKRPEMGSPSDSPAQPLTHQLSN